MRRNIRYNPAYAGTTVRPKKNVLGARIQPFVCRDNFSRPSARPRSTDTTLRMQGQPVPQMVIVFRARYNPAYAGTTRNAVAPNKKAAIQPCVCRDNGERSQTLEKPRDTTLRMQGQQFLKKNLTKDTTLRMQGQREFVHVPLARARYNPAYAGTTAKQRSNGRRKTIQPCVCRDNDDDAAFARDVRDTTLRMQGQQDHAHASAAAVRYNPAYAGTTGKEKEESSSSSIQPCVCRDN